MKRETCDQCSHWHKGYMLHRSRVPSFCNRHFHSQHGYDPACEQFTPPTEAAAAHAEAR